MMGVIRNGLNLNGVNSFWQQVIVGLILLIAVASQTVNRGGNLDNMKRRIIDSLKKIREQRVLAKKEEHV
jgi:hypothetical protein